MKTITITVDGMHCGSCETLVRDALEELDGVSEADVSHSAGTAVVVYDENTVSPEALKAAIEEEGYSTAG